MDDFAPFQRRMIVLSSAVITYVFNPGGCATHGLGQSSLPMCVVFHSALSSE
ncbi:MAG TPA: hypothetical protein DEF41_10865 [Desulfovibrio sp.]|nr:hypothetical protein [Desulfovibrio sp.]